VTPLESRAYAVNKDLDVIDLTALDHAAFEDPDAVDAVDALVVEAVLVEAVLVEAAVPEADLEWVPDRDRHDGIAPRGERHLRVAPDSVRRRRHVRIAAAAAAVSISATLFAVVGFNVELAQHQIKLQKLEHDLRIEQTRYYNLRSEVATRSAPSRVVQIAAENGLVLATTEYLPAHIKPPPPDPAGTSTVLKESKDATKGSLEPVQ
jgi:cell division protein FtsL